MLGVGAYLMVDMQFNVKVRVGFPFFVYFHHPTPLPKAGILPKLFILGFIF